MGVGGSFFGCCFVAGRGGGGEGWSVVGVGGSLGIGASLRGSVGRGEGRLGGEGRWGGEGR